MEIAAFLKRVPWGKFFLLWFLAIVMGSNLLRLSFGFTRQTLPPLGILILVSALGLLWGTTRPKWQKAHCSFCLNRVSAKATRFDEGRQVWVMVYECEK